MASVKERFMHIPPRHLRALEMLAVIARQPHRDILGAIGIAALRDEDEPFTLEQIVKPLWERGLIEDLTQTELGSGGKYFVRITKLGVMCLSVGYMPRDPRRATDLEMKGLEGELPKDADERAAIEGETIVGTA